MPVENTSFTMLQKERSIIPVINLPPPHKQIHTTWETQMSKEEDNPWKKNTVHTAKSLSLLIIQVCTFRARSFNTSRWNIVFSQKKCAHLCRQWWDPNSPPCSLAQPATAVLLPFKFSLTFPVFAVLNVCLLRLRFSRNCFFQQRGNRATEIFAFLGMKPRLSSN